MDGITYFSDRIFEIFIVGSYFMWRNQKKNITCIGKYIFFVFERTSSVYCIDRGLYVFTASKSSDAK